MLPSLVFANLKMIARNRQALFWALVFPLIFVVVFGLFRLDEPPEIQVVVVDQAHDQVSQALVSSLTQIPSMEVNLRDTEVQARQVLEDGDASYLLILPPGMATRLAARPLDEPVEITLLYDRSNATAAIVVGTIRNFIEEMNRQMTAAPVLMELHAEGVQSRHLSYFDFVLPGLVGMGVMMYSIIGLSGSIALYREQKILKRILATPLRVRTFFAAQVIAQLILSIVQALIILAAGVFFFNGHVYGNLATVLALVVVGNIVFLNLGFIVGAIAKNVRASEGLSNAVSLPMMFFSGVFFPNENLPKLLATAVNYLPLSPLLDAMRGVALENTALWAFRSELAILGAWIVVTSLVAVRVFRFN